MTHTLVAAFDNLADAQAAKSQLLVQHILESKIQISSSALNVSADGIGVAAADHDEAHQESFGHKVSHFFSSLFGHDEQDKPHHYAEAYPEAYRRGATVLTVTGLTDEQVEQVEEVLEQHSAIDIDERSALWNSEADLSGQATNVAGSSTHIAGTHLAADRAQVLDRSADVSVDKTAIPVIEEDLRVGKREVNTGRVRVVTRISERPVEETVNLHEEHAHIERHPVNRPAVAGELNSFKAGSIEIQETAEELVVEKSARVVEEVVVGKQSTDHTETVRDTVRRTDVDVQNEPNSKVRHDSLVSNSDDR